MRFFYFLVQAKYASANFWTLFTIVQILMLQLISKLVTFWSLSLGRRDWIWGCFLVVGWVGKLCCVTVCAAFLLLLCCVRTLLTSSSLLGTSSLSPCTVYFKFPLRRHRPKHRVSKTRWLWRDERRRSLRFFYLFRFYIYFYCHETDFCTRSFLKYFS